MGLVTLTSILVLAGCQKPTAPKEAGEVLVNSLIYQEDTDKLLELFVTKKATDNKPTQTDFLTEISERLTLTEKQHEELTDVYQKMEAEFHDKTDYSIKVVSEDKGRADLEIEIVGLKEQDEKKIDAELDKALDKVLEKVTAETSEKEMSDFVKQVSFEVLKTNLQAEREQKEAEVVLLSLMVDAKEKNKWVIQNEDTFINDLFTAFGE